MVSDAYVRDVATALVKSVKALKERLAASRDFTEGRPEMCGEALKLPDVVILSLGTGHHVGNDAQMASTIAALRFVVFASRALAGSYSDGSWGSDDDEVLEIGEWADRWLVILGEPQLTYLRG